jgi:hypothetical protein
MSFDVTPLLLHSEDVPAQAKAELLAASRSEGEARQAHLTLAVKSLYYGTSLGCDEARELVGLTSGAYT